MRAAAMDSVNWCECRITSIEFASSNWSNEVPCHLLPACCAGGVGCPHILYTTPHNTTQHSTHLISHARHKT